jgi:hypothetical protein
MTWIRVDGTLAREVMIGALAESLSVKVPTAVGLWIGTHLGFAEYRRDGVAEQVSDTSLEQWAGWPGTAGRYATAFRTHCVETRDDQPDPPGQIKLWWRQEALLKKAEADARRLRDEREYERKRRQSAALQSGDGSENVARQGGDGSEAVARNGSSNGNEYDTTTTTTDAVTYARDCVIAANTGLRHNPRVDGFNELLPSNQDVQNEWLRDGVPLALATRVIYEKAKGYRPAGRNRQPSTLRYFDTAVRDAWERQRGREVPSGGVALAVAESDLTEGERLARELTREEG